MTFDFCFAEAERPDVALSALAAAHYDLKQLSVSFVAAEEALAECREVYSGVFAALRRVDAEEGASEYERWNAAAKSGYGEWIVLTNSALMLNTGVCALLEQKAAEEPETTAFVLRQFPREEGGLYHPVTMEPVVVSPCGLVVRRSVWKKLGGFCAEAPPSAVSADFTWRLQASGGVVHYFPRAIASWEQNPEPRVWPLDEIFAGNLYLRLKFGTDEDVREWQTEFDAMTRNVSTTPEQEQALIARLKALNVQKKALRAYYAEEIAPTQLRPLFQGTESVFVRSGARYDSVLPKAQPRFSVVVRTRGRAEVLEQTLLSLRNQTYRDFEVIVVEDGPAPEARAVAERAKSWLQLTYLPLGEDAGRCRAGNRGVEAAAHEYICFLDDDDYLYAEHFEVMAYQIELHPDCRLFFAGAVEAACPAEEDPVHPRFVRYWNKAYGSLNLADILQDNPAAIQAVVFHKSLFETHGGLDPALDALEDWDLWIRYAMNAPFVCIEKATSLYRVPAEGSEKAQKRAAEFARYRALMEQRIATYREQAKDVLKTMPVLTKKEQEKREETPPALREAARQIAASRKWKLGLPLRAAAGLVRCFAFGREERLRKADAIAPKAPCFAEANTGDLNRFIFLARTSRCWTVWDKKQK